MKTITKLNEYQFVANLSTFVKLTPKQLEEWKKEIQDLFGNAGYMPNVDAVVLYEKKPDSNLIPKKVDQEGLNNRGL